MSKKKDSTKLEVAQLLRDFQKRLDALTEFVDELDAATASCFENIDAESEQDAKWQKDINKQTTESLYTLRDSTMKSFENVGADVKELLNRIQGLNERIGQLESKMAQVAQILGPGQPPQPPSSE